MKSPCTALAAIALAFTASQPAAAASDNVAPLLPLSLEELIATPVITASRRQEGREQTPAHIMVITREQIGAWLMRFWDMPEELATALRFQHDPTYDGKYAEYPNLVCLAVSLLRSRGIGSGPQHELPDELFERLGLTRDKAEDALDKVLQAEAALRELASQFNHPH